MSFWHIILGIRCSGYCLLGRRTDFVKTNLKKMSQSLWKYYDPSHGTQTVGVYHGDDSGNLVVYCNNKVVMIDFKVKQSKSYSFYINKCLIELKLKKHKKSFDHDFNRTMSSDEINISKKESPVQTFIFCILFLIGILSLINMLIFTFFY